MQNEETGTVPLDPNLLIQALGECEKWKGTWDWKIEKVSLVSQSTARVHTKQWNPATLMDEPGSTGCVGKPSGMPLKEWRAWVSKGENRVMITKEPISKGYSEAPVPAVHAGAEGDPDYLLAQAKRKFVDSGACIFRTKRQCTTRNISRGCVSLHRLNNAPEESCERGEGAYADWGLEPFGSVKLAIADSFSPRIVGSARMVSCHSDTQVWQWAKERAASTEQPSSTVWIHPYC